MPFWVNKREVDGLSKRELKNVHKQAESKYIQITASRCDTEKYKRSQAQQDAYGWFGPDKDKLAKANRMPMPNCEKMSKMQIPGYY